MTLYRRGYNYEQVLYLPAPTGGWNPDVNPWFLPNDQAPILDNFILRSGRVSMRAPFTVMSPALGPNFQPIGHVFGDRTLTTHPSGWITMARKQRSGTAIIDPWHAPLVGAAAADAGAGITTLTQVDLSNGVANTTVATADTVPGPRWINFDGLLYGISYDSVAAAVHDTNSNYFIKPLNLLTLPYVEAAATVPTVLANAPHGAFDVKGWLSRLWLLGGVDTPAGFTVHEPVTLYYTIGGKSGVGTASTDWRDPVAGTTNKITLDNNNADYGVGLAVVPTTLIVFRRSSVWAIRGTTPASFRADIISKEVGCIDARSIVETDHGVYFMSHRGLMLTDGTTVRNVSGTVQSQLETNIQQLQNSIHNYAGGWVSAAPTSLGHILISIGTGNAGATGKMNGVWTGMYDPQLGAWTRMTSQLWANHSDNGAGFPLPPLFVARPERQQLYTLGDYYLVQMEDPATPAAGTAGSFLLNNGQAIGFYDLEGGVGSFPIPARWRTRYGAVVGTNSRRKAQAKRWFLDYLFAAASGAGLINHGWHVQAVDVSDNPLDAGVDTTVGVTTSPSTPIEPVALPRVQRISQDFRQEVTDVAFDVIFTDSNPFPVSQVSWRADIFGLGLEYQETRDYDSASS